MRGEPNTKVVLSIFRKDENRTFPVTIIREEIRTQSVRSKLVEPGYAWIRVSQFQERTVADFARKVQEIYKQDPKLKGLVLDLRNDPGRLSGRCSGHISSLFAAGCDRGVGQRPTAREQVQLQGVTAFLCPRRCRSVGPTR
jgi:C-terminal processing protease CtpA/Prc